MKALFDTNILIDYLKGIEPARQELSRFDDPAISVITFMEVLVGASGDAEETALRKFLRRFERIALSEAIAERAIRLRRAHRLRLPDAIIWATAQEESRLLVTRNTRDFSPDIPGIRVPYALAPRER